MILLKDNTTAFPKLRGPRIEVNKEVLDNRRGESSRKRKLGYQVIKDSAERVNAELKETRRNTVR